ncbi:MAG TPA: hypothetical protein VJ987_04390 [Anaerolineales bacterium]|nr:hypothetical protein [Anaerolineales bacterium]
MGFLLKLHRSLLNLYPKKYRDEYSEELHTVFNLSLDDATGRLEEIKIFLQELMGLPGAIIHEHLRERSKRKMFGKFASRFDFEPGSRNETLAALAPFLLIGALPTLMTYINKSVGLPMWIQIVFTLFMWFSVGGLLFVGFKKGVPRWFMPYLGLPLPFLSVYGFFGLFSQLIFDWMPASDLYQSSWFLGQLVFQGLLWIGLIILIILLLLVTGLISKFRPFYDRIRDDWTLLCFVLYGTAPFALVLSFDDYQNQEPYLFLSFSILAAGGWLYLRNNDTWKRFWSLFIGLALSMFVAAIGKGILYAGPWPRPKYFTWQTEMLSTIIMWIWLALIMFLPLVINLLPHSSETSIASD